MKKLLIKTFAVILILSMVFTLCSCAAKKTKIKDYQYMYDGMVDLWNFHTDHKEGDAENLFGFGEYLYNSHLILFPRETPSTLTDYFFYWDAGLDCDFYAIYFTCKLTEENYNGFCEGLEGFEVVNGDNTFKPLYDDEHFTLPTYVLQWANVGLKWEVLEYVMLDDENNTVVFTYTMSELDRIEKNSSYTVTPENLNFLDHHFSIYGTYDDKPVTENAFIEDYNLDESVYDISFLDYLK